MSVSGASSATGSDASSFQAENVQNLRPGNGEDADLDSSKAWQTGVFGVLYTISKERSRSWQFAAFRLFFDILQLWLIVVNPNYGYTGWINTSNKLWQVVSLVNLSQFIAARGYTFFLGAIYLMFAGLLVAVGLSIWVAQQFQANRFDHVWPIVVLRAYSVAFFQILDVACLTLFLITLDCQFYFNDDTPGRYYHQEFPDVYCWSMPHMIHVAVSTIGLLLFTLMAGMFTLAEMELNPLSHNYLAMAHSKVEVKAFVVKFIMTSASTLLVNLKWLSVALCACSFYLLFTYLRWVPHMHGMINNVRVASQAAIFYCSVLLLFFGFLPGVDPEDPDAVHVLQTNVTNAMWAGIIPSALLGWFACWWQQRRFARIAECFRGLPPDAKPTAVFKFNDSREVEILARCCRKWVDEETLEEGGVRLAEVIMKVGMAQLPRSPYMIILYSSFLIDVQTSYQSGYSILQTAKKADPSYLERFAIFSREQQHTQKSAGNSGQATDLVSYVEFQRNYRLVMKVHKEALLSMRAFWMCLLQHTIRFDAMSAAVQSMDTAIKAAERTYRTVLQRHANNMKVVRLYAKFLEHVKHDPWSAAKWFAEAEKLEQLAEETKASNVFDDSEITDQTLRLSLQSMGPMSEGRCIIIINAQGTVQLTNQAACATLGYLRNELVGRNVNQIIPPPFSEYHNNYIRSYLSTGKAQVLNKVNKFVALHKERHVIPVSLTVSKVSGIGEDTMFMGVIEEIPRSENTAHIWVLQSNQVVATDCNYCDWFGYNSQQVIGTPLSQYVVDYKKLEQDPAINAVAATQQAAHEQRQQDAGNAADRMVINLPKPRDAKSSNSSTLARQKFVHKYNDPFKCNVSVTSNIFGSYQLNLIQLKRVGRKAATVNHMLVSDRKGRVLHITQQLSAMLGSTPKVLMSNANKDTLMTLLTQPFAQLHRTLGASVPPHAPPPYSCRSGLSALFAAVGPQGPEALPFSMSIHRKQQGADQEAVHVMTLQPRTLAQALGERCMGLVLDARGYVVNVAPDASDAAFGFPPQELVGLHASQFIDILSPQTARQQKSFKMREPQQQGDDSVQRSVGYVSQEDESTVSQLLIDLVGKTTEAPGISWRCGVTSPQQSGKANKLGGMHSAVAAVLGHMQAKAAILSVSLLIGTAQMEPTLPNSADSSEDDQDDGNNHQQQGRHAQMQPVPCGRAGHSIQAGSRRSILSEVHEGRIGGALAVNIERQAEGVTEPGEHQSLLALHPPKPSHPQSARPRSNRIIDIVHEEEQQQFKSKCTRSLNLAMDITEVKFQIKLWRSTLVTSILELDTAGRVVVNHNDKSDAMYPPGLVLGLNPSDLYGHHIGELLPLGPRGLASLWDATPGMVAQKKSTLRGGGDKKPGPVQMMTMTHVGDQRSINLALQAVPKLGRTGHTYLLIHPHEPSCGREDFMDWVKAGGLDTCRVPELRMLDKDPFRSHSQNLAGRSNSQALSMAGTYVRGISKIPESTMALHAPTAGTPQAPPAAPTRFFKGSVVSSIGGIYNTDVMAGQKVSAQAGGRLNNDQISRAPPLDTDSARQHSTGMVIEGQRSAEQVLGFEQERGQQADEVHGEGGGEGLVRVSHKQSMKKDPRIMQWVASATPTPPPDAEDPLVEYGAAAPVAIKPLQPQPQAMIQPASPTAYGGANGMIYDPFQQAALHYVAERPDGGEAGDEEGGENEQDQDARSDHSSAHSKDNDRDSSHQASQVDEAEGVAQQAHGTDFRRGRRYKKLSRILNSAAAQKIINRFRKHTLLVVAALMAAHIGIFVFMYMLLQQQHSSVVDLNTAGLAMRAAGEVGAAVRQLDILLLPSVYIPANVTYPLKGLSNNSDIPALETWLKSNIDSFKDNHDKFFLGQDGQGRRLPDAYGLRGLWETDCLTETTQYAIPYNESQGFDTFQVPITSNVSMWHLGLHLLTAANDVYQNGETNTQSGDDLNMNTYFEFYLQNMPTVFADAYFTTMDAMVQWVLEGADTVDQMQTLLLAMEGCVLCIVAFCYMWHLSMTVASHRYTIYSVFLAVPSGLVKSLATKRMDLEEEDGEDEDDVQDALVAAAQAGAKEGPSISSKGAGTSKDVSIYVRGQSSVPGDGISASGSGRTLSSPSSFQTSCMDALVFWKSAAARRAQAAAAAGRKGKVMHQSLLQPVLLTWPFLLWGVIIVACYAAGIHHLAEISGPIATFNMVNSVAARTHLLFFQLQEVAVQANQNLTDQMRARMRHMLVDLRKDYTAMLYGGQALPNETSPHFTLATQGLTYAGGQAAQILFHTSDCLCEEDRIDWCINDPNSTYYQDTRSGLVRLMDQFIQHSDVMGHMTGGDPMLFAPEFAWLWYTRYSVLGGLSKLNTYYHGYVEQVYGTVLIIHIVAFALTSVTLLAFLLFVLRPFLAQSRNETRRITELLTELPPEVDAEGLLVKTVVAQLSNLKGVSSAPGTASGPQATPLPPATASPQHYDAFPREGSSSRQPL